MVVPGSDTRVGGVGVIVWDRIRVTSRFPEHSHFRNLGRSQPRFGQVVWNFRSNSGEIPIKMCPQNIPKWVPNFWPNLPQKLGRADPNLTLFRKIKRESSQNLPTVAWIRHGSGASRDRKVEKWEPPCDPSPLDTVNASLQGRGEFI